MTVGQLIQKLGQYDKNLPVFFFPPHEDFASPNQDTEFFVESDPKYISELNQVCPVLKVII